MIISLIKSFKKRIFTEQYKPTIISLLFNPFFIIRKGIYRGIEKKANIVSGRVLDFGCGSKPYKSLFNYDQYIWIDIEISWHKHDASGIGQNTSDVDVYYDWRKIPFEDNSFDAIFSSETFEHIFNLPEILLELNRVLIKDWVMLITIPFVWEEHEIPFDFWRYSRYGIEDVLAKAWFTVTSIDATTNYVETIFQLTTNYLLHTLFSKYEILNLLMLLLVICPINILGVLLGKLLPKNYLLTNNYVIVAKK